MDELFANKGPRRLLFFTIILVMFIDGFNSNIVSVFIPDFSVVFGISAVDASWIFTIYFLMLAASILIFGKICSEGMIKVTMRWGLIITAFGSLLCVLSPMYIIFLVARCIQGLGAAMVISSSFQLPVRFLSGSYVPLGFVSIGAGLSLGSTIGSLIGAISAAYLSWEFTFLFMMAVCILGFMVVRRVIPDDEVRTLPRFDYLGSIILFLLTLSGLYAIMDMSSSGLTMSNLSCMILSALLFCFFLMRSIRKEDPVVNLKLFRSWKMDACLIVVILVNLCYVGSIYIMPLYVSKIMGGGGSDNGVLTFISGVFNLLVCLKIGSLILRYGPKIFSVISCVCLTIGTLALMLADVGHYPILILSFIALGLMWGFGGGVLSNRVILNVSFSDRGSASALTSFFSYIGGALGTAVYSIFFNLGTGSVNAIVEGMSSETFMNGFLFATGLGVALSLLALFLSSVIRDGFAGDG